MIRLEDITIGCDPEFFLFLNGKPVSAHDMVPGSKSEPFPLEDGAVQADGVAVEFNIVPCATVREFQARIEKVLQQIRKNIPEEYEFRFIPSVRYDQVYFETQVPDYSKELGCEPDYGLEGKPNPKPTPTGDTYTLRTGAGHVHIGFTAVSDPLSQEHMSLCTKVCSRLYNHYSKYKPLFDKDNLREKLYANGPCFRPKSYGLEFRNPSNAWLNHKALWPWIFESTRGIVYEMLTNEKTAIPDFPQLEEAR